MVSEERYTGPTLSRNLSIYLSIYLSRTNRYGIVVDGRTCQFGYKMGDSSNLILTFVIMVNVSVVHYCQVFTHCYNSRIFLPVGFTLSVLLPPGPRDKHFQKMMQGCLMSSGCDFIVFVKLRLETGDVGLSRPTCWDKDHPSVIDLRSSARSERIGSDNLISLA
jgi:hypothetical protein